MVEYESGRCPWAINLGTIHTRCRLDAGHSETTHKGVGLFDYQTLVWFPGDRREYNTLAGEK